MKVYKLERTQLLSCSMEDAWDFFSSPKNLKQITPEYMDFNILSDLEDGKMYEGQIIEYTVKPVMKIPLQWVTEITKVRKPHYFVDNQLSGPYVIWHHQHFFKETSAGVEMKDLVHYALPFSILGRLAHTLFVRKQLESIFDYRKTIVKEIF